MNKEFRSICISFPYMPVVLGHAALKNAEVDHMKSDGQQSKVY